MAPRKQEAEAAVPAPEEDVSMSEEAPVEENIGDVLMREDPHNPAALAFGEQRIRMVRLQDMA